MLKKPIYMKFYLSVMVVFIHAQNVDKYNLDRSSAINNLAIELQNRFVYNVCSLAVPCFFFLSGYLMFSSYSKDKIKAKYKSKFKSLVVPYLIWNFIYMIFFWLLTHLPIISEAMAQEPVQFSLQNIFEGVFLYKYSGILWFLQPLIILAIISPIIYYIFKTPVLSELGVILLMLFPMPQVFVGVFIHLDGIICYLLGAYIALRRKNIWEASISKKSTLICRLALVAFLGICMATGVSLSMYIIFIGLVWFSFNENLLPKNYNWYSMSFFIYLSHIMVMSIIKKLGDLILPQNAFSMTMMFMAAPIISVIIIILVGIVIKKHLPKSYGILTGLR